MKRMGLLVIGLLLSGCSTTVVSTEHVQIAPNKVTCDTTSDGNCLLARLENKDGTFEPWGVISERLINGFTYEPGFLYDLTLTATCTKGPIGDLTLIERSVKSVNSKVASAEAIEFVYKGVHGISPYC